jgi:hypothetical protein
MAFHALRAGAMHPVRASPGCPLAPKSLYKQAWSIKGTVPASSAPCLLSAAFSSVSQSSLTDTAGEWSAWAILNSCIEAVSATLITTDTPSSLSGGAASSHDITVYNISDPGGWASLPTNPDSVPWTTGPLTPHHEVADGPLPSEWTAPPLSFSIVLLHR